MKIVILDTHPLDCGDVSLEPLAKFGELTVYPDTSPDQFAERVRGADIVLTNKTPIGKNNIAALEHCKLLGVLATGINILDCEALAKANLPIVNTPNYGAEDVAQHALALLLELARDVAAHSREVKNGEWSKRGWCFWDRSPLVLSGLTMGVIGFGAIGQITGRYGHALGMAILANARGRKAQVEYPFRYAEREEIWRQADVITLHCPLDKDTYHMVNEQSIAAMKPGAIIINTARGDLIDERAVAGALKSGKLGGLGTDVLSIEPPAADNPLLNAPNTLITPHMAWASQKSRQKIIDIMAENIESFLAGGKLNRVDKP